MSGKLLPLFPLQVVLFPDAVLPLHIFEERYKLLISECRGGDKEFGINLVRENELAKVGCTAAVVKVVKRYNDGQMDILVEGRRRYVLDQIVESSAPYTVGRVDFSPAEAERVDPVLARDAVRLHNQLVDIVYKNSELQIKYHDDVHLLSFRLAQKAGMELGQRQQLLEIDSENQRLQVLRAYLTEVIPKLERLSEVERVIKSDGYIVQ